MGRIRNTRRLLKEDFDKEYRDLIDKLAYVENAFRDDVLNQVNGNLDFDNVKCDLVTFTVTVNGSGIPQGNTKFKSKVLAPAGLTVVSIRNLDDFSTTGYPTSHPWIIPVALSGQVIEMYKILGGLVANQRYELTVRVTARKSVQS